MTLLSSAGFPPTAGALFTTRIVSDYQQSVALRTSGKTIGTPGAEWFGVGPAVRNGAPGAVNANDYYPIHAASGSFM